MLVSKLKEALICLKAGRVTLAYPFEPVIPDESFRGFPSVDVTLCVGCGACASVCPSTLIEMVDSEDHTTIIRNFARCIYCGRCAEICPEDAVRMTQNFETATDDLNDLIVTHKIYMGTCARCGRCFSTCTGVDPVDYREFRKIRLQKLDSRIS